MSEACVANVVDGTLHSGAVLVDIYTPQCPPCRAIAPVVEELCAQRQPELKIVKMDAYENQTTAAKLKISVVPTFILYRNGQVLGRTQGAPSRAELERWLDSLLQNVA
jgi:thioredoxin